MGTVGTWQTFSTDAAFDVADVVFLYRLSPELTGRSREQIEGNMRRGRFTPADAEPDHRSRTTAAVPPAARAHRPLDNVLLLVLPCSACAAVQDGLVQDVSKGR